MENENQQVEVQKEKKDMFPLYAWLIGIVGGVAVLGPIYFLVIASFTQQITQNDKVRTVLKYEDAYIIGVCVVALIFCGILFSLCIVSIVYHFIKNKKKKEEV